jgi:Protein of unknown function DUF262/Protein of unknown function (DUF1524)
MQAHSMPFSKIIDIDQGAREHFHVPKYQREYTWGRTEWEQLLLDIDENEPGYFMGSLICVKNHEEPVPGDELIYEVVDGQQRLTTLSLLLMALYVSLTKAIEGYTFEDDEEKEDTQAILTSLKAKLLKRKKEPRAGEPGSFNVGKHSYFLRVQPSAQNHNLEDYRYVLDEAGLLEDQSKPRYCGVRSIYKAFTYFRERAPTEVAELSNLARKINQLIFVQITVGSQSDAFTLFESLNNRGIPLSAIDIIKNKLLAEMERQQKADIDESFNRWQGIIGALPEVTEQERFLRHFYNAFKHSDTIRVDKVTRATKSQIIRIYETLVKRDALTAFNELTGKAALYGTLLRPLDHYAPRLASDLLELQRIGAASAYQILLFLFALPKEQLQPLDFLASAVNLLCRYHVRRNITDTPATRDLDPAAIELIEACADLLAKEATLKLEAFTSLLLGGKGRPAPLAQLRTALDGPLYAENSGMARYLLIQLDLLHQTREYQPNLWARDDKDRFVWTIEHVLPQAEKLPPHWVQMISGDADPAKAATVQAVNVDRLGNLTLSGYNSDLATSSFDKKQQLSRDRTFLGHKINIGYRNGLALNNLPFEANGNTSTLATATTWSAAMIEARTNAMVKLLIEANKLPGE